MFTMNRWNCLKKQESPPAGNHTRHTDSTLTTLSTLTGGWGTPVLAGEVIPQSWQGGGPQSWLGDTPVLAMGTPGYPMGPRLPPPSPHGKGHGPRSGDGDGVPPLRWWTKVKSLPSVILRMRAVLGITTYPLKSLIIFCNCLVTERLIVYFTSLSPISPISVLNTVHCDQWFNKHVQIICKKAKKKMFT